MLERSFLTITYFFQSKSKDRLYLNPSKGGLGLIRIRDFLISQHTVWVKRASTSTRDNWRVDLHTLGFGNPFTIHPNVVSPLQNPILFGISNSFAKFNKVFSGSGHNFFKAYILNNPVFCKNKNDLSAIDMSVFNRSANFFAISRLRFCDFLNADSVKTLAALNAKYNLNLNPASYLRICGALFFNKNRLKNSSPVEDSIEDFFGSFKKGSKSCRKFLVKELGKKNDVKKFPNVLTFYTLIRLEIPDANTIGNFLSLWNLTFIPNKLRDFIFKFYNNRLGINTRTSHFGGNTRNCTFCTILGNHTHDESFIHLFFECEVVKNIQNSLDRNLFSFSNDDILEKKADGLVVSSLTEKILTLDFFFLRYNFLFGMLN